MNINKNEIFDKLFRKYFEINLLICTKIKISFVSKFIHKSFLFSIKYKDNWK